MKNRKFPNTAKYAVFGVLAVAVGVFSMYGGSDLSKTLKTAVIGDYGYTSAPINYQARNFACYPGPVQPNNGTKYAGTYNTYMFNYGEAYANSGVKGTWCTGYLPSISQDPTLYDDPPLKTSTTNTPTDHTTAYINAAVYKVTDANGQEDVTNPMYRRWLAHKNAAQIHENKVVFYENTLAGYGTYYTTGNSYGGNTALDPNGSGLYGYSVVHCPAGAIVVDHATTASQYKAAASSRHYLSSPTDENGLYDGSGHKWCELNGVSVNPVAGPETGKSMPDFASDKSMLFKFTFPNGSGGSADYYKYHNTWNSLSIASANSDWVKCEYGMTGPFVEGTNNHYISPYDSQTNQNKAKTPHYHCLSQSGAGYTEPVKDTVGPSAPYNTWTFLGGIMYSENTCNAGDPTCGGAGTVGAPAPCSRGTYYYQTTDANYRRCLSSATAAADTFNPPAPTWTIGAPTNLRITGTKITGFASTESVPVAANFAATGTGIPYGQATLTVQIAQDTSFATAWVRPSSTGSVTAVGSTVNSYIDNFPATGTFYWRAKMSLGTQESAWTVAPYGSFVVCSTDKTWNGTSCVTPTVATCALDIKLNDGKTSYTKSQSEFVNYTYSCVPTGTKAASVTVQVVKPDGTATTYNSATNIDTASMGFSTSNLEAGGYVLRACLTSTCTSGVASVNFSIVNGTTTTTTTTTATPTLMGTIYKDGQYVDPATLTLRNCVSPSYWMKEGSTTSGARGFHCMPYMPSYTLTSDHYPPTPCTGTVWAGSDTAGFSSDYCATSKSTTGTVSGTSEPTLMGTIFKDGQYVDPAIFTLRNCVSPNAWMKEGTTTSGARGFHCMPNYTATSYDYPPTSCTGTLWAGYSGGSSTTAVAPDYCAVTKDTNGTVSGSGTVSGGTVSGGPKACGTGEKCASGSWCSNGKQCYYPDGAISCAAWTMGGNSSCATVVPGTKECSPTDTNCIEPGTTGSLNGWCSNSMECFTADGNKKFCQAYSNTPGVQTTCPAGSKLCSSTDTNCIEPGATGSLTGWCKNSMECFTPDGSQKFCQAYSNSPGKMISCPAGSKLCGANDPNCIEPGSTGSVDGWCKNSRECYSKDGTKKYCQSWDNTDNGTSTVATAAPFMMVSCPAEYPKSCRPGDKNCVEVGESSKVSGAWCASGGKQCYLGDGALFCADQKDGCPKDSKKCPTNTFPNPVAYSPLAVGGFTSQCIEDEGPIEGWCGGMSTIQCYNNNGKTKKCIEVNSFSDPQAWENVACPIGYNRCAPNSPGCLGSIGAKGKSGDWCAIGMTKYNDDGTVTCVSGKDWMPTPEPPKPLPELCVSGTATIAYDPATFNCKTFASSCGVPENWLTVNDGRVCQDGKLVNFNEIDGDDASFKKILEEKRKYLKDLGFRLVALPAYVSGIEPVKVLINDAEVVIKGIYQYFPTKTEANRKIVKDKINSLIKDTLPPIETQMNSLNVYVNFNDLAVEIRRDLQRYKIILENADDLIFKKADPRSEYYEKLREGVARLESLLKNAETSTGDTLAQLTTVIKTQWHDLQALVDGQSENRGDDFLTDTIDSLNEALDKFESIVSEKNIDMPFILNHMDKLRKLVSIVNEIDVEEATDSDRQRVNEAVKLRDKLALWLDERPEQDLVSVDRLMDLIDKKVTEAMDKAMAKLENKLEMMMDEQLKQVTIKLTELTEKVKDVFSAKFTELVAQNTNNLAAVPEAQKEILAQDTTRILDRTEALVASVDNSNLSSFEKEGLLGTMETIATHTWCGDFAQKIQSELNSTGLALEADQLTAKEVSEFDRGVDGWIVENQGECYKAGATPGMDVPMESWYHPYTMYNFTRGYMHGYGGDQAGNFGPANATLRIEALAMIMRLLDIPLGDYSEPVGYMGVPSWLNKDGLNEANTYVNGAVSFLDKSWNMSQPITRAETARLFVAAMTSLDKPYIDLPTVIEDAKRYTDYTQFSDDKDATIAIEALTNAGIFEGAGDGSFYPYAGLLRAEFAAITQRVVETFVEGQEGEVAMPE